MRNFVFKTRNLVSKTRICVFKNEKSCTENDEFCRCKICYGNVPVVLTPIRVLFALQIARKNEIYRRARAEKSGSLWKTSVLPVIQMFWNV